MSRIVRWGVIGAGGIAARRTIPEFTQMVSNARIVAAMDTDGNRAREVTAQFGIPHACTTEQELLQQDIDAVYIASPPEYHCAQTLQAAGAGKHILCEKPMTISEQEVDRMEAAVKDAGVKFMLGFCMRNNVYHRKARELVQSGAIGQPVMGRAELTCWFPPLPGAWRQDVQRGGGGSLIDMGTHCLDILEWIFDSRITEVGGFQDRMTHDYPTDIEDASTIVTRFANGAHGIVDNYFNLPDAAAQNTLELHGTKGSIIGQGTIGQDPSGKMFSILQPMETGYDAAQVRNIEVARQEYELEGIGIYGQMIAAFSEAVLNDTEPPVTFEDARHSVRLVDRIYEAARGKRILPVD
jgi:predicted dehydrogenase